MKCLTVSVRGEVHVNSRNRQIKEEELEVLLEAATWAPSGGNNQSWLFTAIQNKETIYRINELLREGFKTLDS